MNLMEQIVDPANFECAWERVKANRGAPGPDGITLDKFPDHFRSSGRTYVSDSWRGLTNLALSRRKSIPKPDGSQRHLGIPT